jgi:hypothetical protein
VALSVLIGVGGCGWWCSSASAVCMGTAHWPLIKMVPVSASAADDITGRMVVHSVATMLDWATIGCQCWCGWSWGWFVVEIEVPCSSAACLGLEYQIGGIAVNMEAAGTCHLRGII